MTDTNGHKPIRSLADLEATHLVCRDISHAWRAYDVRIVKRQNRIERTLECANCGCLRHQQLTMTGYLIPGSRYEYPDGYLLHGVGRMTADTKAEIRLLSSKILTKREGNSSAKSRINTTDHTHPNPEHMRKGTNPK